VREELVERRREAPKEEENEMSKREVGRVRERGGRKEGGERREKSSVSEETVRVAESRTRERETFQSR